MTLLSENFCFDYNLRDALIVNAKTMGILSNDFLIGGHRLVHLNRGLASNNHTYEHRNSEICSLAHYGISRPCPYHGSKSIHPAWRHFNVSTTSEITVLLLLLLLLYLYLLLFKLALAVFLN
jgi:hypothetical protein